MANVFPGKFSKKKVADMCVEEYEQHIIYKRATYAYRKVYGSTVSPSKYPGKHCNKKVADMTTEEYDQHRIYCTAGRANYLKVHSQTALYKGKMKIHSDNYARRNPESIKASYFKSQAMRLCDPVRYAAYLRSSLKRSRNSKNTMDDMYIKVLIRRSTGLHISLIPDEMVVARRATLAVKRVIKSLNNEEVL